jgi:hypothetical protein
VGETHRLVFSFVDQANSPNFVPPAFVFPNAFFGRNFKYFVVWSQNPETGIVIPGKSIHPFLHPSKNNILFFISPSKSGTASIETSSLPTRIFLTN